ncbi:DUF881 domain-containing protein [Metaclostridioides mangenotii]|uniref:DUF881 domain-containing protein n=1 Tax=Metaclostridioides mangenotii TaxID=1540 RepID=UPI001F46A90A|nr:DUF881 domain-containing protein [Clostridioides mangenotii]
MKFSNKYIVIAIACVVLGFLAITQVKSINLENKGVSINKKGEELTSELKTLKTKEDKLEKEITETKNKIDTYKKSGDKGALKQEIDKYERLSGLTDVQGKGIEVTIKPINQSGRLADNKNIMYNYDLILSMINKLNSAQASAISINGNRIVSDTYLHLKGDQLYINDNQLKSPLVIKAIGEPDTLSSALNIKYGIVWEIEQHYSAKVDIEKSENIKVNSYSEKINMAGK